MNDMTCGTQMQDLEALAENLRLVAAEASKQATRSIHRGNIERLRQENDGEVPEVSMLTWDADHSGATPDPSDARAKDVAFDVWTRGLAGVARPAGSAIIPAGEEAGSPTREVKVGDLLIRQDSLDGTTNSKRLWDNFASVQLVDMVRSVDRDSPRARHLAGAITSSTGVTVSWSHFSVFNKMRGRYPTISGRVYLEAGPWGEGERQVRGRHWDRRAGTVAAVAASPGRMEALRGVLDRLDIRPEALYTLGGTPLAAALIGGELECLVEPGDVSLHDSALLIPHQILGGVVTDLDLRPIDYLDLYERSALQLTPSARPIPGYIAWGDASAAPAARVEAA